MKKIYILFSAILIFSVFLALPVSAENSGYEISYAEGFLDPLIKPTTPRYPSSAGVSLFDVDYTNEEKSVILSEFLLERLLNPEQYKDELSLGKYGSSVMLFVDLDGLNFQLYYDTANRSQTNAIVNPVMNDIARTPKLFWYDNFFVLSYKIKGGLVEKIALKLDCYRDISVEEGVDSVIDTINSLTAEFDGYVHEIVNLIPSGYSDYEKILFVNDYICVNYKYDGSYSIYNAYEFFKKKTGVCQAYALAFMACMDELDIKCDYISSKSMDHGWNLVELNGKWYHIDVTWNDPCFASLNTDLLGQATHKYFLLSSDCIQDDAHNHYGFDIDNYGYEMGNEFDNIDIDLNRSIKSAFVELNGIWYNTGYNIDKRTCGLYAFSSSDISCISNEDFDAPICDIGLWTIAGNRYYPYCYSFLAKYKDFILFNTPNSICVFDGTNISKIYMPEKTEDERIYGFTIKGNTIYIQLATEPNEAGMRNETIKTVNLFDIIYQKKLTIYHLDKTAKVAHIYAPIETEGVIFFAAYDGNNILIDCKFMGYTFEYGMHEYQFPNGFDTTGAEKIKVMIFENCSMLNPLCEAYEK